MTSHAAGIASLVVWALLLWPAPGRYLLAQSEVFLSDRDAGVSISHRQQWGVFGLDTAAAAPGTAAMPLRVGNKTFKKGLGHHANGEIVVDLAGRYSSFRASLGVQWQGGNKGSVTFQISVDGKNALQSGPMSDSDPARKVQVALDGARELRLIATDSGDGIGCDMANWAEARLVRKAGVPGFAPAAVLLAGAPAPPPSAAVCGFSLIAGTTGPQVALMEPAETFTVAVERGEVVCLSIPAMNLVEQTRIIAEVAVIGGKQAEVELSLGTHRIRRTIRGGTPVQLETEPFEGREDAAIVLTTRGTDGEAGVRWRRLRCALKGRSFDVPLAFPPKAELLPPPVMPNPRPSIEQELVEWDWRMQDGIDTARVPGSYAEAVRLTLDRGDLLIRDLLRRGAPLGEGPTRWEELKRRCKDLSAAGENTQAHWEDLWRRLHALRRSIALANPLARFGPMLFVKQVPGAFSHQLTQYYGRYARPGGGIFVLEDPGRSMQCRRLAEGQLPQGSYQHAEVSYDGRRVLFAFCHAETPPKDTTAGHHGRYYHLYEMAADGSSLRRLTDGPFDDFSPRYLPDGRIVFISTRRLGWHRCGFPGCENYTLALAEADGSSPRTISRHETQEWDPAVLADGRIIFTRWDYVDRHAIYYEQLWTARPDGSSAVAYYGNNTFNPVGIWEPRQVPGSRQVMATAAAHHAMTAGSIILVDVTRGLDGPGPITRLTPDVPFPESEAPLLPHWRAPAGVTSPPPAPIEAARWPGHCYRSPCPLSENYFLTAYSFDPLIGEPKANRANMFGIYLVDRFGNKELLYRDLNISSLWPAPLRPRRRPPVVPSAPAEPEIREATVFLQDVYAAQPPLPAGSVKRLRIVQVLPKSTPGANRPPVGIPNASPGKQVLGTVPVEPDGSALFHVPPGVPLSFQALDEHGRAVQIMRSLTYFRSGERLSCVGCHEPRTSSPPPRRLARALGRPPSAIRPAPEGSKPLSYPILVQPVLDRKCVGCHNPKKPDGKVVLTGEPQGHYTVSYNALAPRVPYSAWGGRPGDFRQVNSEPLSQPGFFGARGSPLMKMLLEGHEKVELTAEELERLATWMDANVLFYGTFDPQDQARQQRGQRIAGPKLQ